MFLTSQPRRDFLKLSVAIAALAVKPPQATGFLDELGVATDDIFGKEDAR